MNGSDNISGPEPRSKRLRGGWLLEVAGFAALYFLYDRARDAVAGSGRVALDNAKDLVTVERWLWLYHERTMQRWVLPHHWLVSFWNIYYGTIHFVMPVVALAWLYHKFPRRYVVWRNTLLWMLGIGLVCFWLYPLMPPRLMPHQYGFVDTPSKFFNFGPQVPVHFRPDNTPDPRSLKEFGNLFAAMPSLHVGWSTFCAVSLFPIIRRRWIRVLLVAYPCTVIFGIVVTGNHWILDAVGGWIVLAAGWFIATRLGAWHQRRARAPDEPVSTPAG